MVFNGPGRFVGGGTMMAGDVFDQFIAQRRNENRPPDTNATLDEQSREARKQAVSNQTMLQKQQEEDLMLEGMQRQSQYQGQGRGMPQQNRHQQTGYADLQDPSQFGKETLLPWDETSDTARNFAGIINSFDPRLFQTSENIVNTVAQMGPAAEKALGYKGSIYEGVSDDFAVNRLYIANTRRREESIYAFV